MRAMDALSTRIENDDSHSRSGNLAATVRKIKDKNSSTSSNLRNILKKHSISMSKRKRSGSPMLSTSKRNGDKEKVLATTRSAIKMNSIKVNIARSNSVERVRTDKLSVT